MAGPHGSAFVHAGFLATQREIIEIFSPMHNNPSIIQLCLAMEHKYHQIVAANTWIYRSSEGAGRISTACVTSNPLPLWP
jgi:hypothetical protein